VLGLTHFLVRHSVGTSCTAFRHHAALHIYLPSGSGAPGDPEVLGRPPRKLVTWQSPFPNCSRLRRRPAGSLRRNLTKKWATYATTSSPFSPTDTPTALTTRWGRSHCRCLCPKARSRKERRPYSASATSAAPRKNDRDRGGFPMYIGGRNGERLTNWDFVQRAQDMIRKYGEVLVDRGLLAK